MCSPFLFLGVDKIEWKGYTTLSDLWMFLQGMATVVKWLRHRIVAPVCVGSNPISRPIFFVSYGGVAKW